MSKLEDYINSHYSLEDEYFRLFGRELPSNKFKCPNPAHQHINNTPSCKAYGNVFKCFGQCNRVFGVYHLWLWYDPQRLKDVKSSVILQSQERQVTKLDKVVVDRSQSIAKILESITGICLISQK